jgi:6-phosphofructokinase 1
LSYAARLGREGFPVIAIPKTMDNDVHGTEYCIGFSTAVTRSVEHIHSLRSTTGSHERICVVELFGRHSGETALIAGWLADVDRVVIAESPCDVGRLAQLVAQDRRANPSNYAMVVVSEGARLTGGEAIEQGAPDAYGRRRLGGVGERIGEEIERRTGVGVIVQRLAYLMRAGPPDSLDRMVAVSFGALAVQQIERRAFGVMLALKGGRYAAVPLAEVGRQRKQVDMAELFDAEAYRPKIHHLMDKPMFLY